MGQREVLLPGATTQVETSKGMKGGEDARVRELGAPRVLCPVLPADPCATFPSVRVRSWVGLWCGVVLAGEQEPGRGTREHPERPVPVCGTALSPSLCPLQGVLAALCAAGSPCGIWQGRGDAGAAVCAPGAAGASGYSSSRAAHG